MLAYSRIEALRLKGRTLGDDNSMPNVESIIKQMIPLVPGTKISKYFEGPPSPLGPRRRAWSSP